MTTLLDQAFDQARKLPESDQDQVALWLIEELRSEKRSEDLLGSSPEKLARLVSEARDEYRRGLTELLDPERL